MNKVLPFITRAERERIKRALFITGYMQEHLKDHDLRSMPPMLKAGFTFCFYRTGTTVEITKADLEEVTNELNRRKLIV